MAGSSKAAPTPKPQMKRVLTAAILIPLVLLAVFRAPNWALYPVGGARRHLLALSEYFEIVAGYGVEPLRFLGYLLTVTMFAMAFWAVSAPKPIGDDRVLVALIFLFGFSPFVLLCAAMPRPDLRSALPAHVSLIWASSMSVFRCLLWCSCA